MKIYTVYASTWDYDEYDAFVVVAENAARAIALVEKEFNCRQKPLEAIEVNLTKEDIILGSFNAG